MMYQSIMNSVQRTQQNPVAQNSGGSHVEDLAAKLFIGGIVPESLSDYDLEQIFSKYGRILDRKVLFGYGYVQFEKAVSANIAMSGEQGRIYKGSKFDIKTAAVNKKQKEEVDVRSGSDVRPGMRFPNPATASSRLTNPATTSNLELLAKVRTLLASQNPPVNDLRAKAAPPVETEKQKLMKTILQIIIRDPKLKGYAEVVKERFDLNGIRTDIRLLPSGSDLTDILEEITKQFLYGVVITEQNVLYHSVSVLIFHGEAQEHRNMPLNAALTLVGDNYKEYLKSALQRKSSAPAVTAPPPKLPEEPDFSKPDDRVRSLLLGLADGKFLSLKELDLLQDYISQRRKKLIGQDDDKSNGDEVDIEKEKEELQSKIYKILKGELDPAQSGLPPEVLQMASAIQTASTTDYRKPPPVLTTPLANPSRPPPDFQRGLLPLPVNTSQLALPPPSVVYLQRPPTIIPAYNQYMPRPQISMAPPPIANSAPLTTTVAASLMSSQMIAGYHQYLKTTTVVANENSNPRESRDLVEDERGSKERTRYGSTRDSDRRDRRRDASSSKSRTPPYRSSRSGKDRGRSRSRSLDRNSRQWTDRQGKF